MGHTICEAAGGSNSWGELSAEIYEVGAGMYVKLEIHALPGIDRLSAGDAAGT